jgi:dienelactone hydrolase
VSVQRVGIRVENTDVDGVLHLPDTSTIGGAAVLHGFGGDPDQPHIVATCDALANAGIAALRFAYRDHRPPRMTLASGLADAAGAIRVLKAHPDVPERLGVVGFSFGGTVAALVAGRDSRIRAAVLAAAPAVAGPEFTAWSNDGKWKPVAELSRTRARVLLVWGSRDSQVPFENAERYAAVLSQARVPNRIVTIEGGDHDFGPAVPRAKMTATIAEWMRESLG